MSLRDRTGFKEVSNETGQVGVRIPLPGVITPAKTFLCHRNNSANQFDIRIEIRHALFGTTFTQAGIFREVAA